MPQTKRALARGAIGASANAKPARKLKRSRVEEPEPEPISGSATNLDIHKQAPEIAIERSSISSSGAENVAPSSHSNDMKTASKPKARRGRKPFTAKSKLKATVRRKSAESAVAKDNAPAKTSPKRKALVEIEVQDDNDQDEGNETEEVDDFDDLPASSSSAVPALAATSESTKGTGNMEQKEKVPSKRGRRKKVANESLVEVSEVATEPIENAKTRSKGGRPPRKAADIRQASSQPPTQQSGEIDNDPMEVEDVEPNGELPIGSQSLEHKGSQIRSIPASRSALAEKARERQRQRTRSGSISDTERRGASYDSVVANLRRKLADVTARFDSLELQYRDLEEVGLKEAEQNFDELKKASEDKTKAANDLIASLRTELSAQKALAAENTTLKKQVADLSSRSEGLSSQNKALQSSLAAALNESKALQAKLSATRTASASAVPDSAIKNRGAKTILVGSSEAAKEAQKRVLKEEFYSDLSGLLVLDVKRNDESGEDIYDCIQTGRNGTLHFYLSVLSSPPQPTAYEDEEFTYTPHLDASRDRDLLQLLPDYLTEEICFPRSNAAKFYGRLVDCMYRKVELVDGVDD